MRITDSNALGSLGNGMDLEQRLQLLDALIQRIPIPIALWRLDRPDDPASSRLVLTNHSSVMRGATVDLRSMVGQRITDVFPEVAQTLVAIAAELTGGDL